MHHVPLDSVNNDIGQGCQYKFPRACSPARASTVRHLFQRAGRVIQSADCRLDVSGMILLQIEADTFQVGGGCMRPPDVAQEGSMRSTRASISSSSKKSPRTI